MRIRTNNKCKFECLDDIIPNPLVVSNEFLEDYFSSRFITLLNDITDSSIPLLFMQYYGKSKSKKLNSFIMTMINSYGLKRYGTNLVVDSNDENIICDDVEVAINDKDFYYSLRDISIKSICELIDKRYYLKWSKLYETLAFEYNPIEPFTLNVEEKTKDDLYSTNNELKDRKIKTTDNEMGTNNGIRDIANNINENDDYASISKNDRTTENETVVDTSVGSGYGYQAGINPTKLNKTENSYEDKTTDVSGSNVNSSNKRNHSENSSDKNFSQYSKDNNRDESVVDNGITQYSRSNPRERDTKRSGNIGNIPQQELVIRERNLWEYQLYDTIFKDLDKVLVIATYRCG